MLFLRAAAQDRSQSRLAEAASGDACSCYLARRRWRAMRARPEPWFAQKRLLTCASRGRTVEHSGSAQLLAPRSRRFLSR